MTLHDLFTLYNLSMGTSGHGMTQPLPGINTKVQYIRYTSEYIPKLQLHQHKLSHGNILFEKLFKHCDPMCL